MKKIIEYLKVIYNRVVTFLRNLTKTESEIAEESSSPSKVISATETDSTGELDGVAEITDEEKQEGVTVETDRGVEENSTLLGEVSITTEELLSTYTPKTSLAERTLMATEGQSYVCESKGVVSKLIILGVNDSAENYTLMDDAQAEELKAMMKMQAEMNLTNELENEETL